MRGFLHDSVILASFVALTFTGNYSLLLFFFLGIFYQLSFAIFRQLNAFSEVQLLLKFAEDIRIDVYDTLKAIAVIARESF